MTTKFQVGQVVNFAEGRCTEAEKNTLSVIVAVGYDRGEGIPDTCDIQPLNSKMAIVGVEIVSPADLVPAHVQIVGA